MSVPEHRRKGNFKSSPFGYSFCRTAPQTAAAAPSRSPWTVAQGQAHAACRQGTATLRELWEAPGRDGSLPRSSFSLLPLLGIFSNWRCYLCLPPKERKKETTQNTQGDHLVSLAEQAVEGEIYCM